RALEQELGTARASTFRHFSPMDDLRLSEPDSSVIFVVFDDTQAKTDIWLSGGARAHSINYPAPVWSPSYVQFLLQARAPALPDWYVFGCVRLYETMEFKEAGVSGPALLGVTPGASFGPERWLSDADASALDRHPDGARPLVPMGELFAARYPAAKSDAYRRVWEAQAELFVRWALSGQVEDGPDRLRRFVAAAATRRTTEEFFYSCFGMDYADALEALSDYLPRAVGRPIFVPSDAAPRGQPIDLRSATAEEVRAVKSEWSRRVLGAIRADNPGAYPLFEGKTRDSFGNAFAEGERDPEFLASYALFRIQYGNPDDGTRLLEQFPHAASARPIARLELAQQRLLGALAKPAGAKGALSDDQASAVLREISVSNSPIQIESAYAIAAKTCAHLGRDPTPAERKFLVEGARLFPRDSELVVQAAAWDLRAGAVAEADDLIQFGLWECADPAERRSLVVLDNLARQVLTVASVQGRAH
ncbi:MAG TPA: hypothetical protein VIJ19_04205, partial [Opitutaceae bacterium]